VTSTATSVGTAPAPAERAPVEELLRQFGKGVRAHQLYLQNNPIYQRTLDQLRASFGPVWHEMDALTLSVTETELVWQGAPVLHEPEKASDSLPWLFYKDGVREVEFLRGFEESELVAFLEVIQRVRRSSAEEDDLLTLLWERDFSYLRYKYVDVGPDGVTMDEYLSERKPLEVVEGNAPGDEAPTSGIVSLEDFDATLYFLDEREVEYLRSAVRDEYAADLRRNVVSILLDVFETQKAGWVRDEVCSIVDSMLVHLLSAGQFRSYLIQEAAESAARAPELADAHRARLLTLPDRLSDPAALTQLLESLDGGAALPPAAELATVFEQLRGGALSTLLGWLHRTTNAQLRALVEGSTDRLAAANTAELARVIASGERATRIEAIRRAASLKTAAAVPALGKALTDADDGIRLATVLALAEIASPGALQNLERGVDDANRDVRIAAARALATRTYRPALARVEAALRGRGMKGADLTERMALFEAYGSLCGDGGVDFLDGILNAKGFLGRREDTGLRACAAVALGRIATARATDALRKAATEKDAVVRNAVSSALRGGTA
jgi:HEAT repeats